MRIRKFKNK